MDMKREAKQKMLQELKKMATEMMGGEMKGKLDGMKKVTVAAKDKEGLKAGLEKAEEMMEKPEESPMEEMEELVGEDLDMDDEEGESMEHKAAVLGDAEMSPEEIQEKIKELQSKLEMMKK